MKPQDYGRNHDIRRMVPIQCVYNKMGNVLILEQQKTKQKRRLK